MRAQGRHWGALAALLHRASGVALALFLPLHFLALGLALDGAARLDGLLRWTEQPLLKASEAALVVALTVHLALGLRVLVIEFLPWRGHLKGLAAASLLAAAGAGAAFLASLY